MSQIDVMEILKEHGAELRQRFGVRRLSVFGSVARGEISKGSDVDLLVDFEGTPDFDRYMDLKFHLEDLLGRKVDLATRKSLRPQLKPRIEQEAIDVA